QLAQTTREAIEIAVRLAARDQRCVVRAGHRLVARVRIMPNRVHYDGDLVTKILVGPDMRESGIAAKHLAAAPIHHAAADRFAKLKPDGVEATKHDFVPRMLWLATRMLVSTVI